MRVVGGTDVGDEPDDRAIWERETGVTDLLRQVMTEGFHEVTVIAGKRGAPYQVFSTFDTAEGALGSLEFGKARILHCRRKAIEGSSSGEDG